MSWKDTLMKSPFKVAFPNTRFDYLKSHVVNGKEALARVYSSKKEATPKDYSEFKSFLEKNGGYSVQKLKPAHKDEQGNMYEWYVVLERNE